MSTAAAISNSSENDNVTTAQPVVVAPEPIVIMAEPITGDRFTLNELQKKLRALSIRHDECGQEILLNETLRILVEKKEFEQAELMLTNCVLTEPYHSTNQHARYCYYVALIRAIRLDYGVALQYALQALRKAPERALGFRIAATKLFLTLQLLNGETPARSEFLDPHMKEALYPYMQLTSCVRFGNLGRFMSLLKQFQETLEHDKTYTLILRVRQNVIRTGLKHICQAYSRIALNDICVKLSLENPDDVEYIVSKAIREGVVDATINHEEGTVSTSDTVDIYSTTEPMLAYQKRIAFLNELHADAKRALRYVGTTDPELENERQKREREELGMAVDVDDGLDMDFSEI